MRRAPRGFTLLELTIALAIAAVAMTVGAAALGAVVDRRDATRAATRDIAQITATRDMLTEWIANSEFDTKEIRVFDGAPDEITFRTTARTLSGDAPSVIRLFVTRDALGSPAGLAATVTEVPGGVRRSFAFDSSVVSLALRYRANEAGGGAWADRWISTTVLPAAVEVRLSHRTSSTLADAPWTIVLDGGR